LPLRHYFIIDAIIAIIDYLIDIAIMPLLRLFITPIIRHCHYADAITPLLY
jgi:hypothetical protein